MTIIAIKTPKGEFYYSRDKEPGKVAFTENINVAATFEEPGGAQAFRGSNSFGNALAERFEKATVSLVPVEVQIRKVA